MTFKGGKDKPHKKASLLIGVKEYPPLSIQCFEGRHSDCFGIVQFMMTQEGSCTCKCHQMTEPKRKDQP